MMIGRGGEVRGSSKWASPSIICALAPTLTLLPIVIDLKHHIDTPLNPHPSPIESLHSVSSLGGGSG